MAHKTLIDGTAYEISGGRTLVNGTGYDIASGKTLVGGTAYEVGFGKPVTITVTGQGSLNSCYILYDDEPYYSATSFTAYIGHTITFYTYTSSSYESKFYVNGILVAERMSGGMYMATRYNYTVVSDATINLNFVSPKTANISATDSNA